VTVRLLVSVRSSAEAVAAATGGADIIDVKEPLHGSLGRPSGATVQSIQQALSASSSLGSVALPPLSCALGELLEWFPAGAAAATVSSPADFSPLVLQGYQYAKAGAAGCSDVCVWQMRMQQLQRWLPQISHWVAAAYADAARAGAPEVEAMVDSALECGCRVLLVDTWLKDSSTLLDWLPEQRLERLSQQCAAAGLELALAGRLQLVQVPRLLRLRPAILAVRGAVCEAGDRSGSVSRHRVAEFVSRLQQTQW
jgi:uncharacterized protein (UPF0264 family)